MDDFQCHDTACDDMNKILLNSGHLAAVHSLELLNFSKLGILPGSILSLIGGSVLLVRRGNKKNA
ncbi:MAG: hypothetical protein V2B19_33160 [Pseudomonadota bacterium]